MFDKLNPFKRRPQNPLDLFTVDELRAARVKLERSRDKTLGEIKQLETKKADDFQYGVGQPDLRGKRIAAQRIKETEEQIRQLDQQLSFSEKQLQIVGRLEFLKRNHDQLVDMGIDKLLGNMDTGELRTYVEQVSLTGEVSMDRLNDLSKMLGDALNAGLTTEDDPEIADLIAQMEMASLRTADLDAGEAQLPAQLMRSRESPERNASA